MHYGSKNRGKIGKGISSLSKMVEGVLRNLSTVNLITGKAQKANRFSLSMYRVVQKKRGHSTFSQISRKLLKISK